MTAKEVWTVAIIQRPAMRERTSSSARPGGLALEAVGELGAAAHRLAEQDARDAERLLHERGDVGHDALASRW